MTSILTNSSALSALATLRSIDRNMGATQERISSGLRVGSAADNAAYWAIATTMKSDAATLSTVNDALGLGLAKVEAAYTGLDTVKDILGQIKNKLVAANEPGADRAKINAELTQLKEQIRTTAASASFSGENWLYNNTTVAMATTKDLVGGFTRDSAGAVAIQTISFATSLSNLMDRTQASGILSQVRSGSGNFWLVQAAGTSGPTGNEIKVEASTAATDLANMQTSVEAMLSDVIRGAATLGAIKTRIENQTNFLKGLNETFQKGISNLVDADMNEESTKLKALQTQQQLGIQALSIANSSAQNIMQLFR